MCVVCTPAPAHHPPRSHLGSPPGPRPQPIPARSSPAGCSRLHAEWGAPGTQAGMAVPVVPGFACKKKTRPATTRVAPPFSGFRRPRALRAGPVMATPASGTRFRPPAPPPQQFLVPPVPHRAQLPASTPAPTPAPPAHPPNLPVTRAPASPRAPGVARSQRPEHAGSTLGCENHHPRPAGPLSQPGSPASCAATAARDPPPSRLPLSCLFRSTNNFCSDAGSLGPWRPLLPAPPSGYENSKQLADLRADQLRLPPTPAFRANPAAAASKISLRAGLGGGGGFSRRGCLRSKEPLYAPSSPPK